MVEESLPHVEMIDMDNLETQPLIVQPGPSTMVPTQPEPTSPELPMPGTVPPPLVASSDANMVSPPAPIAAGNPKNPIKVLPPVPMMPSEPTKPDVPKMQYVRSIMTNTICFQN